MKILLFRSHYLHNYSNSSFLVLLHFQTETFKVTCVFERAKIHWKFHNWEFHKSFCSFRSFIIGSFRCLYTSRASSLFILLPSRCRTSVSSIFWTYTLKKHSLLQLNHWKLFWTNILDVECRVQMAATCYVICLEIFADGVNATAN